MTDLAKWDYLVRGYYKRNGLLAFETTHKGEHSMLLEVSGARTRADIERVEVWSIRDGAPYKPVATPGDDA